MRHKKEAFPLKAKNTNRIRQLHQITEQAMNEAMAQMELTASQGCAMGFLSHQTEPPLAKDFEEAFHLSHSCAAGILGRLEKKKFIEFRTDPQDRRCKRIYILPKGRACHDRMHAAMEEIDQLMTQDFTPEERELFSRLLDRAITNMGGDPCSRNHKEENK